MNESGREENTKMAFTNGPWVRVQGSPILSISYFWKYCEKADRLSASSWPIVCALCPCVQWPKGGREGRKAGRLGRGLCEGETMPGMWWPLMGKERCRLKWEARAIRRGLSGWNASPLRPSGTFALREGLPSVGSGVFLWLNTWTNPNTSL